jgi:hypothetical protein
MFKNILAIIIVHFLSANVLGQSDSVKIAVIDNYVTQMDTSFGKPQLFSFTLDSIQVSGMMYKNKLITKSHFTGGNTTLTTVFYLKDNSIIFVSADEPGKFHKRQHRYFNYYFEDGTIIFERCRGIREIGIAVSIDGENPKEYADNLTCESVKDFVCHLSDKLMRYR